MRFPFFFLVCALQSFFSIVLTFNPNNGSLSIGTQVITAISDLTPALILICLASSSPCKTIKAAEIEKSSLIECEPADDFHEEDSCDGTDSSEFSLQSESADEY